MNICIRDAQDRDLEAINEIYNDEILNGTATWDEAPWTIDQRRAWFAELRTNDLPVLVAEVDGSVGGFAYLSAYRAKTGYRFTREDTIYLARRCRGKGLGTPLLTALIQRAQCAGAHLLVGVISGDNEASIQLHRKLGFTEAGTKRECGFKFGRWLDVVEMVRILDKNGE